MPAIKYEWITFMIVKTLWEETGRFAGASYQESLPRTRQRDVQEVGWFKIRPRLGTDNLD